MCSTYSNVHQNGILHWIIYVYIAFCLYIYLCESQIWRKSTILQTLGYFRIVPRMTPVMSILKLFGYLIPRGIG